MLASLSITEHPIEPTPSSIEKMEEEPKAIAKRHQSGHSVYIRDSIIGFSDGVTVPFALTAGLSSLGEQRLVILGGLAELFAGAISMGLGAWMAAITERKHFEIEEARATKQIRESPNTEEDEVLRIFEQYGVQKPKAKGVVDGLKADEKMFVQFMMDFELKIGKPRLKTACVEGLVMGISYFIGGLLPLLPYFIYTNDIHDALFVSIGLTGAVLLAFGFVKAKLTGTGLKDAFSGAVQTLIIGGAAAGAAYGIVRAVNSTESL